GLCRAGARPVGEAVAPSCPGVGLRAPTDHTANARGIVVTVDGPKPTDTQRHREGRGENGKQRTTAAPVRAHHESSAGKHHITPAHQSKEYLGRRAFLSQWSSPRRTRSRIIPIRRRASGWSVLAQQGCPLVAPGGATRRSPASRPSRNPAESARSPTWTC